MEVAAVHALARVGNRKHHILTGFHLRVTYRISVVQRRVRDFDRQLATIRHSVAAVDRKIQNRGLELGSIDDGVPEPAARHIFDGDLSSNRALQHGKRFRHDMAKINNGRLKRLPSRKGEKLLDQTCATFGRTRHHIDALKGLRDRYPRRSEGDACRR